MQNSKAGDWSVAKAFVFYSCPCKKTALVKQRELNILSHSKRISIELFNPESQKEVIYTRWYKLMMAHAAPWCYFVSEANGISDE